MGRHSSRYSRSRSRSYDHHHHRHHSRSHSYDRSHHHHHYDDNSSDRGRSRSYRSHKRDRSRSARHNSRDYRSHSRHSHHSQSHSHTPIRKEKNNLDIKEINNTKPVTKQETVEDSTPYILQLKSNSSSGRKFRFDDQGREVNEFGEVINVPILKPQATLAINRKQQQKSQINPYLVGFNDKKPITAKPKLKNRLLIDSRIKTPSRQARKGKALNFIKEGTFIKKAEEMRTKAARDQISQTALASVQKSIEDDKQENETPIPNPCALPPPPHNPTPNMEWWDYDFLPENIANDVKEKRNTTTIDYDMVNFENCITREVIEHPVIIERNKLPPPKPLPLMLTKKERKKERRKNRAEREEEKRIRIQAGLLPKPEQKLTYRNYKQILGTKALMEPTWADNLVKEQIEQRKLAHQLRNEERKLTPQEASEKKQRKVIGDKNGELQACLYRIESLSDRKQRFKVSVNAEQYHLVGRCLIVPSVRCVMLYVEGTKKALRHYTKLLLHRINWNERVSTENADENDDTMFNSCTLLWEGSIQQYRFKEFIMKDCDTDIEARHEMEEKSLVQHWDSVVNYIPEMNRILSVCYKLYYYSNN